MDLVILMASPRPKGYTSRAVAWLTEELILMGHQAEVINLAEFNILPCNGCSQCQDTQEAPFCPLPDDVSLIWEKMIPSDALIWAAPVYFWSLPARAKALLERSAALVTGFRDKGHHSLLAGKKLGLLATCGGPAENADQLISVFSLAGEYFQQEPLLRLVIEHTYQPDKPDFNDQVRTRYFARLLASKS